MKAKSILVVAIWATGIAALPAMQGCSQETPPGKEVSAADKAAAAKAAGEKAMSQAKAEADALPPDMVEMKGDITRMTAQIDVTMSKLDKLASETGDIDKPSEEAVAAIDTLEAEAKSLQQRGEQMRDRGAAYFEQWEKQLASMSTPEVAAVAAKRKEELSAKYAQVLTSMQTTRAALDSYWDDMKSIKKDVDKGLNSDAHKLLAGRVKAAKDKAATLKTRIQETFAKLNDVSLIYAKH